MFKEIFKKFPGLHSEMLAESFSRYVKEFRRPVAKKRNETLISINKKSMYSKVSMDNQKNVDKMAGEPSDKVSISQVKEPAISVKTEPIKSFRRSDSRTKIFVKQEELKGYKNKLDELNEKAN